MMSVEKRTGRAASITPCTMAGPAGAPGERRVRRRKTFSSTTMEASTRMPKSMAPMEIRFAERPVSTIMEKENSTANGMVAAAMSVVRRSPSMSSRMSVTSTRPVMMTCFTVCVCELDEPAPVVDRAQVHPRRQQRTGIQRVDLLLQGIERRQAFFVLAQQHNGLHDIALVVAADLAKPRLKAFMHVGDVAHQHRCAVLFCDHHVAEIVHATQQAQRAHVDVLVAHGKIVAACIGVGVLDRRNHLRKSHSEGEHLVGIGLHLVLLRGAAKRGDVHHTGYLLELAAHQPVLRGLQVVQSVRTGQLIPVNLAHR